MGKLKLEKRCWALSVVCCLWSVVFSLADTHYVDITSTNATPPYTNWFTAATVLQDAVDEADSGETVSVAGGVYNVGSVTGVGTTPCRVVLTRGIHLEGVDGASNTVIEGCGPLGDAAVRCAYVGDSAVLKGFTLRAGHTSTNGSIYTDQSGGGVFCGSQAWIQDCVVVSNEAAGYGGGIYKGTISNCVITANVAVSGGGVFEGDVTDTELIGNTAHTSGAGVYGGSLTWCTLAGNFSEYNGGGAAACDLVDGCIVRDNAALNLGGGTHLSNARNSAILDNEAYAAGGVYQGRIENCTITGNAAENLGGGVYGGVVLNSIVYHNQAPLRPNWYTSDIQFSCTIPLPNSTCITNRPGVAGTANPHLSTGSPCIDAGTNVDWAGTATDIDGDARIANGTMDMGCDEYTAGAITGSLSVGINPLAPRSVVGAPLAFEARIVGRPESFSWDWGDGASITNNALVSHAFASTGRFVVVLQAWNASGSAATSAVIETVVGSTNYAAAGSADPQWPFTDPAHAAATLQEAVDANPVAGGVVLVANGVYDAGGAVCGGSLLNRVAITNPITVRALGGPGAASIVGVGPPGDGAVRCAFVGEGAMLEGFTLQSGGTLTNGWTGKDRSGGGARCEAGGRIRGCVLENNAADAYGGGVLWGCAESTTLRGNVAGNSGGGAAYSALQSCAVYGNSCVNNGGGTYYGELRNCTVCNNSADLVGGSYAGTLRNSIIYYNQSFIRDSRNILRASVQACCTEPYGAGSFTNAPGIVSLGNPLLVDSSPCIDAGLALEGLDDGTDIQGEARIYGDAVDVGCDEYHPGGATGSVRVAMQISQRAAVAGYPLEFEADIEGSVTGYVWNWGDGSQDSNVCVVTHAYLLPGDYEVVLQIQTDLGAVSTSQTINVRGGFTNYVDAASVSPNAPYTNWAEAATSIQDAVSANALAGGVVLVRAGRYDVGGTNVALHGSSRVAVTRALAVRSVVSPGEAVIDGGGIARCVYLGEGSSLSGFTLTNGYGRTGGGVLGEGGSEVRDCVIRNCLATDDGGGIFGASATGCTISDNEAQGNGGGIHLGVAAASTISGNTAGEDGGGSSDSTVQSCLVAGNRAGETGGGTYRGTVSDCVISNNVAVLHGGGARDGLLDRCLIRNNEAQRDGGGVLAGFLKNCSIIQNRAEDDGGGAMYGSLQNCTVAFNTAGRDAGGCHSSTLLNCIVYDNESSNGTHNVVLDPLLPNDGCDRTCTTPDPGGAGNITNPPAFLHAGAHDTRLGAFSPCIDVGAYSRWMDDAADVEGNPRIYGGQVDMGAHEFTMTTDASAFLAGAYLPGTGGMGTVLSVGGLLPLESPYAGDLLDVPELPTNTTDWVLAELLDSATHAVVTSGSGVLRDDGRICGAEGEPGLRLEAPVGHYYLAIKHRSHLTIVSAGALAYTNELVAYDFTTGPDKYMGGTNACVELEPGVWGMIAGDCDGDGKVSDVDRAIVSNQLGKIGYLVGDLNLDGVVSDEDEP